MCLVNTMGIQKEFNRLIGIAYDKGRVVGYNQSYDEIRTDIISQVEEFLYQYVEIDTRDNDVFMRNVNWEVIKEGLDEIGKYTRVEYNPELHIN